MNEARFRPEAVAPQPQAQAEYQRPQMDIPTPGTQLRLAIRTSGKASRS